MRLIDKPPHPNSADLPAAIPSPLEQVIVYGNPAKKGVVEALGRLGRWTAERGIELSLADDLAALAEAAGVRAATFPAEKEGPSPLANGDTALLVCLGGDGTLLHATRRFWPFRTPVLAVNLGMTGFNATVEAGGAIEAVEAWQSGRTRISQRMVLKASHLRQQRTINEVAVLNDVVLTKHCDSRLIHLGLSQGREQVADFAADGLIVATPTGSTAYNLSAGGPIVVPTLRVLIVTAICPHTLTARPVILPADAPVQMRFVPHQGRNQAAVLLDGQVEWLIEAEDRIHIEPAPEPLRLTVMEDFEYFSRLRQKLSWSGDAPDIRDGLIRNGSAPSNAHQGDTA